MTFRPLLLIVDRTIRRRPTGAASFGRENNRGTTPASPGYHSGVCYSNRLPGVLLGILPGNISTGSRKLSPDISRIALATRALQMDRPFIVARSMARSVLPHTFFRETHSSNTSATEAIREGERDPLSKQSKGGRYSDHRSGSRRAIDYLARHCAYWFICLIHYRHMIVSRRTPMGRTLFAPTLHKDIVYSNVISPRV